MWGLLIEIVVTHCLSRLILIDQTFEKRDKDESEMLCIVILSYLINSNWIEAYIIRINFNMLKLNCTQLRADS